MKKKYITLILSILPFFIGCKEKKLYVNANVAKQETLISLESKTINYGNLLFLKYIDKGKVSFLVYEYLVDKECQKIDCEKIREVEYDVNDKIIDKPWSTSNQFKEGVRCSSWEKYFTCFSENFLDLTNDEKIKLLDEIASKCEK